MNLRLPVREVGVINPPSHVSRCGVYAPGSYRFAICVRSDAVYERQVELTVGQTLQVGDVMLTIVEIDGEEIHFRLDEGAEETSETDRRELVLAMPR